MLPFPIVIAKKEFSEVRATVSCLNFLVATFWFVAKMDVPFDIAMDQNTGSLVVQKVVSTRQIPMVPKEVTHPKKNHPSRILVGHKASFSTLTL